MENIKQLTERGRNVSRYLVKIAGGWVSGYTHSSVLYEENFEHALTFREKSQAADIANKYNGMLFICYWSPEHNEFLFEPEHEAGK